MSIQLSKKKQLEAEAQRFRVNLQWVPNGDVSLPLFDLDLSAFLVGGNAQIPTQEHFVFYNNQESPDGAVQLCGDDRVGGCTDSDGEVLEIDTALLELSIQQIYLAVSLHEAAPRGQAFGSIANALVRIDDVLSNQELCRYALDEDFSPDCAVEIGRFYRSGEVWRFEPLGNPVRGGLQLLVNRYAKRFA